MFYFSSKSNLLVGAFAVVLSVSVAMSGHAQSAGVSDADYLSALTPMAAEMDLGGLAQNTYAPVTVAAPQLSDVGALADMVSCESLQAQAAESGHPIEIFEAESTLSSEELSGLSKCEMSETGLIVSYLMTGS